MSEQFKSGFVALAGRPNAGKSSFVNACVGTHLAPVSSVSQTTRTNLRAVINQDDAQIVLVDTPGFHKPKDALGKELNRFCVEASQDADEVLFFLDASAPFGSGDNYLLQKLTRASLLITKSDLATETQIAEQIAKASKNFQFQSIYVTSSKTGAGIEDTLKDIANKLPEGPRWFSNELTDLDREKLIQNMIEEQVMRLLKQEIPHAVAALVESIEERPNATLAIHALLLVERESQKAILVGHKGSMIKRISTDARKVLEQLFGQKIYLDLRVKVRQKWRQDANVLRELGF